MAGRFRPETVAHPH